MAFSGNEITRLTPMGVPGAKLGSFVAKTPAVAVGTAVSPRVEDLRLVRVILKTLIIAVVLWL